jgi:hypothetical protein
MTTDPLPTAPADAPRSIGLLDEEGRQLAAACVAGAALGSWPAFTLGVYGVIFFEQHLSLWAASTSVFLALGLAKGPRIWAQPRAGALLLPSLWILITWIIPVGGTSGVYKALFWIGAVITVVGMPALAAVMVRLLIPGAERLRGRRALGAVGVVSCIMLVAFGLGTQHPRILTCEDFSISGNFAPANCSPGQGSTAP